MAFVSSSTTHQQVGSCYLSQRILINSICFRAATSAGEVPPLSLPPEVSGHPFLRTPTTSAMGILPRASFVVVLQGISVSHRKGRDR